MDKRLPIHFFTIVLNGEPFIRHHIEVFKHLPFEWHWHVVEGVAALKHDTSWSLANGGRIDSAFHCQGRSNDGTASYLDALQQEFPERVTIYRKPEGVFWDGKLEMVNAPLMGIRTHCLLWQVDVDEIWALEQILSCRKLFLENPGYRAAFFRCHFFVGPALITVSRETYGNNSKVEWLRVWNYRPGDRWLTHEPPRLGNRRQCLLNSLRRMMGRRPKVRLSRRTVFCHAVTEARGLVFAHYAYVLPEQVAFKERYYGYTNAQQLWRTLQDEGRFPVRLKHYFQWVKDETIVDLASRHGVLPWKDPRDDIRK